MSRLVAGRGLTADEIRSYPDCRLADGARPTAYDYDSGRDWVAVDLESIDLIKLAPVFMILAAQTKAEALIAHAQAEADEIRAQARRGGEAEGRTAGKLELLPSLIALTDAGQSLIVFEERMVSESGRHLVELALEIAEKIIDRAVEADPQVVASVLERAKTEVAHAKQIRIWLHPDDAKVLEEVRPDLLKAESPGGRTLEVVPSLEISRGGCRLETESGIVDATIPTQLEEMRRQLLGDETPAVNSAEPAG